MAVTVYSRIPVTEEIRKLIRLNLILNSLLSTQTAVASYVIQAKVFNCRSGESPALACKSAKQICSPTQLCPLKSTH